MRALAMGSLTTVLTSVAIGLGGCGGSGKSSAGAGGAGTSGGTSASSTLSPFLAKYEKVLTSRFANSGQVPGADVPKLVNCTIKKLESQGVTTANAPNGAHQASVDAEACARGLGLR